MSQQSDSLRQQAEQLRQEATNLQQQAAEKLKQAADFDQKALTQLEIEQKQIANNQQGGSSNPLF